MMSLAAIFLLSPITSVLGPAVVALLLALIIFCSGAGIELSAATIATFAIISAAIPVSAFFGVALVRRVVERSDAQRGAMEIFATVLAAALALQSTSVVTLFGAAGFLSTAHSPGALLLTIGLTMSHALFAAGLAAFVVSSIVASADLLSGWFARSMSAPFPIVVPALQQVIVLLVVAGGFDLMIGLFSRELAPLTIVHDFIR